MNPSPSAPALRAIYVPRRKRPSIWLLLPVLLLVGLSLLPLLYVGLKAWQAAGPKPCTCCGAPTYCAC